LEPRVILDGGTSAQSNLALEEALLRENAALTLRLWSNERSIVIGRAQLAEYETDVARCAREGIPIVRRITAGGAVYNGPGNINWSFFVGSGFAAGGLRYVWDVRDVFRMCSRVVVMAAEACGAETWFDGPNRILAAGGKVSGMAAYLSRSGFLCHGTMLLDADLEEAASLTRPSDVKLERRYARSNQARIANTGMSSDAFIGSMRRVLGDEIGMELEDAVPTEEERRVTESLLAKYCDPAWNLGDPFGRRRD
jgi:lipoate-protein ligase A